MSWTLLVSSDQPKQDMLLEWIKALSPVIGAVIAIIGVAITIIVGIKKSKADAKYTYAGKALDLRLKQLNEFYAPILLQIEQSRILYKKLLWTLERLGKRNPAAKIKLDGFRLLDHAHSILKDNNYIEVQPLVKSILEIGKSISERIEKNSGLVEGGITTTLIEYRAHLQMLIAAAEHPPAPGDSDGWQEFGYYPRVLNREITEGYKEVLRHFTVFQDAGDEIVWRLLDKAHESHRKSLNELLSNLSYYEKNADSYAARFDSFDLAEIRSRFINHIRTDVNKPNIKLMDAGCGTGRDTVKFIENEFSVTAFDVSPAMVRKCSRKIREIKNDSARPAAIIAAASTSKCDELTFDELRYRNEFDAIWASASLLHVPKCDLQKTMDRLMHALKPNGVLFISLKHGTGEAEFDSRHYSYFSRREVLDNIKKIKHTTVVDLWLSDNKGISLSRLQSFKMSAALLFKNTSGAWLNLVIRKTL